MHVRIFVSYASEDRPLAERIAFGLRDEGHTVFLDRDDLPAGQTYDGQIRRAIETSDLFIFLISPSAIESGRYTLTELEIARRRIRQLKFGILPVAIEPVDRDRLPATLMALTWLTPEGAVPPAVVNEVADVARRGTKLNARAIAKHIGAFSGLVIAILVALALVLVIGPLILLNAVMSYPSSEAAALRQMEAMWGGVELVPLAGSRTSLVPGGSVEFGLFDSNAMLDNGFSDGACRVRVDTPATIAGAEIDRECKHIRVFAQSLEDVQKFLGHEEGVGLDARIALIVNGRGGRTVSAIHAIPFSLRLDQGMDILVETRATGGVWFKMTYLGALPARTQGLECRLLTEAVPVLETTEGGCKARALINESIGPAARLEIVGQIMTRDGFVLGETRRAFLVRDSQVAPVNSDFVDAVAASTYREAYRSHQQRERIDLIGDLERIFGVQSDE